MRNFVKSNLHPYHVWLPPLKPQSDVDHVVAIAQQSLYIGNSAMLAAVNFINASVIVLLIAPTTEPIILFGWYLAISALSLMGFRVWRNARGKPAPRRSSGRFLAKAEIAAGLTGLLWGLPILLFDIDDPILAMFFLLVASGMVSGFVSMLSQCPRISLRFIIGTSGPVFFGAVNALGPFSFTLGTLIVVLGVSLMILCFQNFSQLLDSLSAKHEAQTARSNLFEAIESINDAFAIHDDSGRVIMCNSTFTRWFPNGLDVEPAQDESVHRLDNSKWVMRSVVPTDDGRRVSIHNDITALKTREQQLIAARREAEDANLAKARFMATMSHELRTPLNIIIGFSSIMSSKSNIPVSLEEMRDHADSIHDAGKHLLNVIDDIIEFAQVGSDRYIHTPEAHDPRDLISRSIALSTRFLGAEERKGIELAAASTLGQIIVDEAAFRRILMSLVSNAIKFGGSPTRIHVRAYLGPAGEPMISVRDFGRGIAPADLEKIFEPFFQCEADRGGEFSGTGLGLALARQIARLHGGDVSISSRQGAGTTATIILPASAHIPPAEVAVPPALPVKNVSAA